MIAILTQCFPPEVGGVENLMAGLAEALAAAGRRVEVFADGPADPEWDGRQAFAVKRFAGWKPLRRRLKARAASRAIATADIVFADSWKSLELAPTRQAGRARIACLAHGMETPADAPPSKARRIRAAFAKAHVVIANSRYTAELCRPHVVAPTRLVVRTPPIPPQPEVDADAARRLAVRLGEASPLIATLARLEPRKGIDRVIEAIPTLIDAHPGLKLAVAGSGADRERLEAVAERLGVADRVAFLGRITEEEKAALFQQADLFAMPARREGASVEGFGIVYLEAGWRGAPALAGREGGAGDAVVDGATGRLCDGGSPEAVASALAGLLSDPVDLHRMSFLAAAHAREQVWAARASDFLSAARGDAEFDASGRRPAAAAP